MADNWDVHFLPLVERFYLNAKKTGVPELYKHLSEKDKVAMEKAEQRIKKVTDWDTPFPPPAAAGDLALHCTAVDGRNERGTRVF